ncbi:MAG: hypothetical protein ACLPXT_14970 [Terracidiphilus sp.]
MTIQVELSPEAEANLAADAVLRGIALEKYAGKLLEDAATSYAAGTGILTPEDVEELSRRLSEGSEHLPILPPEVNDRASYYEDR